MIFPSLRRRLSATAAALVVGSLALTACGDAADETTTTAADGNGGDNGVITITGVPAEEETDTRVQTALRSNGATEWQVFFGATLRQVAPAVIAHIIYQLDVNFRSATLLGVVGAGGIGFYLLNANRVLQFEVVTFILVLVVAVVLALEAIAVLLRNIVR